MNNGSFLVQLTGKLIFAYVKSLVTVILLVPHCRYINLQWGTIAQKDAGNILYTNINFNTSGWAGILAEIADTNKERVSFGAFRFISKSTYIINSISITSDKSIWYGNRTWFYYIAIGK